MENGMKLKSIFFYQAVKVGPKMINSAADKDFDLSFHDGLAFIHDKAQGITVAVPTTNIPQMQLISYAPECRRETFVQHREGKACQGTQEYPPLFTSLNFQGKI